MMEQKPKIRHWALPLSCLYGLGVALRNALFDYGVLKQERFRIPVISVGNLAVGGTGKTPHVEYLVRLLMPKYKIAVLSRGYKRKTHGYVLANENTPMQDIGDEPWQIKHKFPSIHVAVDSKRTRGIQRLTTDPETSDVQVILLDDAFQHRYVRPSLNILLTDFHRLYPEDRLLPAGLLREPKENAQRADIIIVTKCPHDIKPLDFSIVRKMLNPRPFQRLLFTTLSYGPMQALFHDGRRDVKETANEHVLLITGIAKPQQMLSDLQQFTRQLTPLSFPDHHYFSSADIERINQSFAALPQPSLAITTEKDATRLKDLQGLSEELRQSLYVLPTQATFLHTGQQIFNNCVLDHINKRIQKNNGNIATR